MNLPHAAGQPRQDEGRRKPPPPPGAQEDEQPQQAEWWEVSAAPTSQPDPTPFPEPHAPSAVRSQEGRDWRPLTIGLGVGLVAALIAFVLLERSSSPAQAVKTSSASASSSVPSTTTPAPASTAPSTTTTKATATGTQGPSYPLVAITGIPCGRSGSGPYSRAAAGNDHTSCPFARAVRDAYLALGVDGASAAVPAYSAVTKRRYTMTCTGDQPVRCVGGNDALVWLYGGDAMFS